MTFLYNLVTIFDGTSVAINRSDGVSIPFDPDNTDFAQFKVDLSEGAELQNADGVAMTQAEVDAFLEELP